MAHTWTTTVSDEEEKWIDEVIKPHRKFISDTPGLLSLLYDIDLLPEQIRLPVNATRMVAVVELWKRQALTS